MNIVVEKNVALPATGKAITGYSATLRAMEAGDSFCIPVDKRNNLYSIASAAAVKVVIRKVDADTCRVWRV